MTTWTWIDFITLFTQAPLRALERFFTVCGHGFLHNWWQVLIALGTFWVARKLVFALIDFLIPRRYNRKQPRWMGVKFLTSFQDRWQDRLLKEALETRGLQRSRAIVGLMKSTVDPLMGAITFFTIFALLGMELSTKTSSILLGALSLAVGLGTQGVIKDMLAGITLLVTDTYAVGDYVDMQFGVTGVVKHIGMRLTVLEAPDGTLWNVRHSEVPKIGNLTAAKAVIFTDIELTWQDPQKLITSEDLKYAEEHLDEAVQELSEALDHVDSMARNMTLPSQENYEKMVTVLPDLVPTMTTTTLTDLAPVQEEVVDAKLLRTVVKRIPGRVPIFTKVETLGLTASSAQALTLRLRITLPPKASRAQALAVLRRAVFEAFIPQGITCKFFEVEARDLPMSGLDD